MSERAIATVITEECPECGSDLAVGETCIECEPTPAAATDKATVRHTPQPWTIDNDDTPWTCGDSRIALEEGEEFGHTEILFAIKGGEEGDDQPIAYCPWEPLADNERQEELRGNARLIAAAPALYAIARKLDQRYTFQEQDERELRAALALAEAD